MDKKQEQQVTVSCSCGAQCWERRRVWPKPAAHLQLWPGRPALTSPRQPEVI